MTINSVAMDIVEAGYSNPSLRYCIAKTVFVSLVPVPLFHECYSTYGTALPVVIDRYGTVPVLLSEIFSSRQATKEPKLIFD
jgi:hypothetical protein